MGIERLEMLTKANKYVDTMSYMRENTIYLIMGLKCNFSCSYCCNRARERDFPSRMSPELETFLTDTLPAELGDEVRMVQFWGGEPLLYLNEIKRIISRIGHIKNYQFMIVTNGSLLTGEIVDWMNAFGITCGISHDGPMCGVSRTQDILQDQRIVELIHRIERFAGFSTVLSPACSDIYAIDNYFSQIMQPSHSKFDIQPIFDTNGTANYGEDFDKNIATWIYNCEAKLAEGNLLRSKEWQWMQRYVGTYIFHKVNPQLFEDSVNKLYINLDMDGNCYLDHDGHWRIGDLNTPVEEIIDLAVSLFESEIGCFKTCKECEIFPICQAGRITRIVDKEAYCSSLKRFFVPIIEFIKKGELMC